MNSSQHVMQYHFDPHIQDECYDGPVPDDGFYCELSTVELALFESLKITKSFPKGRLLFVEGQPPAGVYVLSKGRVKLSTCTSDGKVIILGIAGPGDALGLTAILSNDEYETTAEALDQCQVDFVPRDAFLNYLRENKGATLVAAKQLSQNYRAAHKMICSLAYSEPVLVKLAKLFLNWSSNGHPDNGSVHLKNLFTHEQMAEMIGTTRETVTRSLREMRERGLVTLKGSNLIIHSKDRLRLATGTRNWSGNGTGNGDGNGNRHCDDAHRRTSF